MNLTIFDYVLFGIVVLVIIKATLTGFITEFFSKASVIAGTIGAVLFYRRLAPYVERLVGSDKFSGAIAFLVLFIVLYLLVKLIQQLAGSAFQGETMTNLDRALGFFFGIAEGLLLVLVLLSALRLQSWFDSATLTKDSLFMELLDHFLIEGKGFFPGFIPVIQNIK